MTLEFDDAGVGDLLGGVVIGVYRSETREFSYDVIDVKFFQPPEFSRRTYLREASEIVSRAIERMRIQEDEPILICSSYLLERAARDLREKYGKDRVIVAKITSDAQRLVETAYLDEVRNLGYEPLAERDEKRGKSFFHMLRWLKRDRRRLKYAKTGWPRLKRYLRLGRLREPLPGLPSRRHRSRW